MTYLLFLIIAVVYNIRKFHKMKDRILIDLTESNEVRRNTILSHFYWVFIVEIFLGLIVADWLSRKGEFPFEGMVAVFIVSIFLAVSLIGFFIYQPFLKWIEKQTNTKIRSSFNRNLAKEFRISFALGFLPILLYALITKTFLDENDVAAMGFDLFGHILFVSVLSIVCTVIVMMKLIPNCEMTEPQFLGIIQKRLEEANLGYIRVRWIEAEFKNAFVVGLNFPFFKNQTMFIGRPLSTILNTEEFDAVICHEIAHIREGHMAKRILAIFWHILRCALGTLVLGAAIYMSYHFIYGIESYFYLTDITTPFLLAIFIPVIVSYFLFFDAIRSQEFEADAITILDFGCRISDLESAIKKITSSDNPYQKQNKRGLIGRYLSTHPTLEERVEMLHKKVDEGLPYDYKTSVYQKSAMLIFSLFKMRYFAPLSVMFCLGVYLCVNNAQQFSEKRFVLAGLNDEELIKNEYLNKNINARPIFGHSNLYYAMIRKNSKVIDHFLANGADPEKVIFYLTVMDDNKLAAQYLNSLGDKISDNSFDRIARKIYRQKPTEEVISLLQESPRFQKMLKAEKANRMPASATSTQLDNQ